MSRVAVVLSFVCFLTLATSALAQSPANPKTSHEVQALLDREKPDTARLAKLAAEAEAQPPAGADRAALARFHFQRSQARTTVGRIADAIADTTTAIDLAGQERDEPLLRQAYVQLGQLHGWLGERRQSNEAFEKASELGKRGGVCSPQARCRRDAVQLFVELQDRAPLNPAASSTLGVYGLNCGFQLKASGTSMLRRLSKMSLRLLYQCG